MNEHITKTIQAIDRDVEGLTRLRSDLLALAERFGEVAMAGVGLPPANLPTPKALYGPARAEENERKFRKYMRKKRKILKERKTGGGTVS